MKDLSKDTFTQFSYACKQFGIEIKTTSVAQAKGRVERLFQTLRSRLPAELRQKGITTINEANVFLNSYIKEYNARFALPVHHSKSVFVMQPNSDTINQTLAILTPQTVDNAHCIKFQNKYYKPWIPMGCRFSTNDRVYELDEIPLHEQTSKNFDSKEMTEKPRKRNIPSPKHPWRDSTFLKHVPYGYFPECPRRHNLVLNSKNQLLSDRGLVVIRKYKFIIRISTGSAGAHH